MRPTSPPRLRRTTTRCRSYQNTVSLLGRLSAHHPLLAWLRVWWTIKSVDPDNAAESANIPTSSSRQPWLELLSRDLPPPQLRRLSVYAALLISIIGFVVMLTPSGLGMARPGPVVRLDDSISGSAVIDATQGPGWFAFTTVEVVEVSYATALVSWFRGDELSKLSDNQNIFPVLAQMRESVEISSRLALYVKTGEDLASSGVLLVDVREKSPAAVAGLRPGDVLHSADGVPLGSPGALLSFVKLNQSYASYAYTRDGVRASARLAPRGGKIGVYAAPSYGSSLAGVLDVDTNNVGGPSAGLMLSLATLDALHGGDLTARLQIAGTGTISADGRVGPVAGVRLKLRAAEAAGAELFFVPSANFAELDPTGGVKIYQVDTLLDAVKVLCSAGATDAVCTSRGSPRWGVLR